MMMPYAFLPIAPEHAVHDAPMWRDGSSAQERYRGELLISIEALTPLIVGNQQYRIDEKHSALVPQMFDDGRVLIAGSSLKGMLRAALAGLLNAPMSLVAEHHYTYRPNFGFGPPNQPLREVRAAVVESITAEEPKSLKIKLLSRNSAVVFVRDAARALLAQYAAGDHLHGRFQGVVLTGDAPRMRLEESRGRATSLDHYLFEYRGGIDGAGLLARAFNSRGGVYRAVLVEKKDYEQAPTVSVPERVVKAYEQTQRVLADDRMGHLSPGHPLAAKLDVAETKRQIKESARLVPGQLIYVEIEYGLTASGKRGIKVVSMGHHFQYRWAYSSSIRCKNRLIDGKGELRPELALHEAEQADAEGAPARLTGARLLFGYAVDGRDETQARLAQGNFKRMAGRITFNTAIEEIEGKTVEQRFIEGGRAVQLKILGMPRPSAVEFYLKQTELPAKLVTYGDLPTDAGGELAGRKYYRHQPDAQRDPSLYRVGKEGKADANAVERGTIVRYLSAPGSRFRCTLRFDSLRPWELGALLIALEPALAEPLFGLSTHRHGYAHKLGYGKPLGLGSVRLTIDAMRWRKNDCGPWQQARRGEAHGQALLAECLAAFKQKLIEHLGDDAAKHLERWRKTLWWQERGRAAYPTKAPSRHKDGERPVPTIYDFHTDIRRRHAAARRGKNESFDDLKKLLSAEKGVGI